LQFGDRLDAIVVGYVLWTLVLSIMDDIAFGLQYEAQVGTSSRFSSRLWCVESLLARAIASLTLRLTLNLSILLIILALTGVASTFL